MPPSQPRNKTTDGHRRARNYCRAEPECGALGLSLGVAGMGGDKSGGEAETNRDGTEAKRIRRRGRTRRTSWADHAVGTGETGETVEAAGARVSVVVVPACRAAFAALAGTAAVAVRA